MEDAGYRLLRRQNYYLMSRINAISDNLGRFSAISMIVASMIILAVFGLCLTAYVVFIPGHPYVLQTISSSVKLPIIFTISASFSAVGALVINFFAISKLKLSEIVSFTIIALFMTSICILCFAPIIAIFSSLGNYSAVILGSYVAFLVSALVGALFFYRQTLRTAVGHFRALSIVWCVLFLMSTANIGWELRPLVGWTGQPFQLVRTDQGHMWDQVICEVKNMRFGGVHFPAAGQEAATKAWPC